MSQTESSRLLGNRSFILKIVLARRSLAFKYFISTLVTVICLGISQILIVLNWGQVPFMVPLAGAVLIAVIFGFGPAFLCSLFGVFGVSYWVAKPAAGSSHVNISNILLNPIFILRYFVFIFIALLVSNIISELRIGYLTAEQLKAETERQSAARQHVVDIVSHDLRNPIASIKMYASLLFKLKNEKIYLPEIDEKRMHNGNPSIDRANDKNHE